MRSLVITTPATDMALLTITELRAAAGANDGSRDAELISLERRVADSIMSDCNIAIGAGGEPTLRRETLTETIYGPHNGNFKLSRRHKISITTLTLDGIESLVEDYFVEPESGFVYRLPWPQLGTPCQWWSEVAVVVYDAGFDIVPGDLKQAAMEYFQSVLAEEGRDRFVKSISQEVPGLMTESKDFWIGSIPGQSKQGPVPDIVGGQLKRFRNLVVG